ncbi:hypothetical protein [Thalassorhabdomicrobium marinisediminis]|uniref:Uncharacterized protein n=1 Tax=Thalassorhabdomicrobium marinisediminis TaxID=2170577 RepID=A0A2T7FWD6_9RHOB|nr:hypothetical protein [Thalassorhabdomicrobium marinisediminis]PVA06477.1 hypothetical protein DC363_11300 [Thalassorhabdomicrobium marinisediminis]
MTTGSNITVLPTAQTRSARYAKSLPGQRDAVLCMIEAAIADPSFRAWPQLRETLDGFHQTALAQHHFFGELAYALYQLLKTDEAQRDHHQSVADTMLDMASWSTPRFPDFYEWDPRAEQFGRTAELMYLLLGDTARFSPAGFAVAAAARSH